VSIDYRALGPEIAVAVAACVILLVDLGVQKRYRWTAAVVSIAALAIGFVFLLVNAGDTPRRTLGGLFVLDDFSLVVKGLFLAAGAYVVWLSALPMRGHRYEGEYYVLLLSSILGTLLMPSSRDLLMLFISLELVSAPAFVLAGFRKLNPRSNEAALKFFLIGVLSAGVLVYGISLVYGFTGSTDLATIARAVATESQPPALLLTGVVFIVAAFGFKVSAVPFHFWAPDTYEGSPTPLAAFLSVSSKAAGFVGLLIVLLVGFPGVARYWAPLVAGIAAATMTLGNVLALRQRQLVRLLAYSSIGHAGYMLIPIAIIAANPGRTLTAANASLVRALVVYLLAYAVMNLGAFAVVIGLSKQHPTLLIRDITGLARRAPLPAMALAVFLVSLGGIPPLVGWFAKFAVFLAAVSVGSTTGVVLAVFMVVNSVISLYYYVGVVRAMYLQPPEEEGAVEFPRAIGAAVAVAMVGTIVLGIYPEPVARLGAVARNLLLG
jgi:NADH-quinone oxidoreductase subunit N